MPDGALEATADTAPDDEHSVFSLAGTSKLISYVPGRGMERHKPGTAKRMPAGSYLRWNMHYQANGRPMTDRTELGVWFNTKPATHEILNRGSSGLETYIVEGVEIPPRFKDGKWKRELIPNIPAYAANWRSSKSSRFRKTSRSSACPHTCIYAARTWFTSSPIPTEPTRPS